jgi:hypothetical protein
LKEEIMDKSFGLTSITQSGKFVYVNHNGNMGCTVERSVKPNVDYMLGEGMFDRLRSVGVSSGTPSYSYYLKIPLAKFRQITVDI